MTLRNLLEAKNDYVIYNNTYKAAIGQIADFAKAHGYTLDNKANLDKEESQLADKTMFTHKPKPGETNKFSFTLYTKANNEAKKALHVQVYNRETDGNAFELNMYIL